MEIAEKSRDAVVWQPSQNQAFTILAGTLLLAGLIGSVLAQFL
jgi:hypothetical protein